MLVDRACRFLQTQHPLDSQVNAESTGSHVNGLVSDAYRELLNARESLSSVIDSLNF